MDVPFQIGALYSRATEIHDQFGGQRRGGISTPANSSAVFIFTGEAGKQHGYSDFWDDDGIFHYYGEGQSGDMKLTGGNRAILRHATDGKRLLLFQMMGKGRPCRYLGEFNALDYYEQRDVSDTAGTLRTALVFRLEPFEPLVTTSALIDRVADASPALDLSATTAQRIVEVRRKQDLFRRRLVGFEKGCRITGIRDLRFLRASHIKPWAKCVDGRERTDGNNGLLLVPTADHLLDKGWLTFDPDGRLLLAKELPTEVKDQCGLPLTHGKRYGTFTTAQQSYLEYHRNAVFEREYTKATSPRDELLTAIANNT